MAAAGAHMTSVGDSPAGPAMISPALYAEFALPAERALVEAAHAAGLPHLIHICGDTTAILAALATAGADAVELDYLTDAAAVRAALPATALFGTVDPSGVIARGTPDAVRAAVDGLLTAYRDSPRLVLGAGCAIPPGTPEDNLRALVDRAHQAVEEGRDRD
jgi:uroporphyrinogen-III decarboxylase